MALFQPDDLFRDVTHITPQYLRERGIRALVLDVDNTLTDYGSQHLPAEVKNWLEQMQQAGIALTLSSNNFRRRVKPFADRLGLGFVAFSLKPLPLGLHRAGKRLGTPKAQMALVGDQIFTDCLAANLYGITMLQVLPRPADTRWNTRLKRRLEQPFLRHYLKKGGTLHE